MPYLYIFAAVILFFVVIHKMTELNVKQKIAATVTVAVLIVGFYLFESHNTQVRNKVHTLTFAFEHGKTIFCDGMAVNKEKFNYKGHSFLGKKGTDVYGKILPINRCEESPE